MAYKDVELVLVELVYLRKVTELHRSQALCALALWGGGVVAVLA